MSDKLLVAKKLLVEEEEEVEHVTNGCYLVF